MDRPSQVREAFMRKLLCLGGVRSSSGAEPEVPIWIGPAQEADSYKAS